MLSPEETIIIQHLLIDDEGMRPFPYFDCCGKFFRKCRCVQEGKEQGKLTIGVGRNIEDVGISESEAILLEMNDVKKVTMQLERSFPWFSKINTPRRIVILSMCFNLGIDGLKEFKKMIKCIESGDFFSACKEMLNSKWSSDVKERSIRLAEIMKSGQF